MKIMFSLFIVFFTVVHQAIAQINPIRVFIHDEGFPSLSNIRFTPDGIGMVTCGGTLKGIRLWNFETGELIHEFEGSAESIDFNSNYSLMATGQSPGITALWDFNSRELLHIFEGHEQDRGGRSDFVGLVQWLAFSNNDKYLVTAANDGKAIVWNLESKSSIHTFDSFYLNNPGLLFRIGPVAYSPDDTLIGFKHSFWNASTFEFEFKLDDNTSSQFTFFSKSGKYFMSNASGNINIFDWNTKEIFKNLNVKGQAILHFDLSPNEQYILAGSFDGNAYIIDINTEKIISINVKDNSVRINNLPVQFHPSGDYFAVGGDDGKVFIYDFQEVLASQSQVKEWKDYE